MTIANITINGHTYTNADWQADWEGTISAIANDIAAVQVTIDAVSTLNKTISGDTTLSSPEGQNLLFVFDGALSGDANITFPSGFKGLVGVVNKTTGSHQLVCKLASGATATVPASGGGLLYCDGTDFGHTSGWVRTSAGTKVTGTASVSGAMTIGGAATLSSTASIAGAATITGAASLGSTLSVTGAATVGGAATVTGALRSGNFTGTGTASVAGAATIGGAASIAGAATVAGGALHVANSGGEARTYIDAPAGSSAWVEYDSAGVLRWLVGRNNTAESGGDAGSNFDIVALDDAGSNIGIPFRIYRGTLYIRMNALPTSSAGLESGVIWCDTAADNVLKKA